MVGRKLENFGIFELREPMLHAWLDQNRVSGHHDQPAIGAFHQYFSLIHEEGLVLDFVMMDAAAQSLPDDQQLSTVIAVHDPPFLTAFLGYDSYSLHKPI